MCPKVRDGCCYFIPPYSPTGRGLPGKELHAGQIDVYKRQIMGNLEGLFDTVNTQVGEIAAQVVTTPADVYKRQQ